MLPSSTIQASQFETIFVFKGNWTIHHGQNLEKQIKKLKTSKTANKLIFDTSGIENCDSAGLLLLEKTFQNFQKKGKDVSFSGLNPRWTALFEPIRTSLHFSWPVADKKQNNPILSFFEEIGKKVLFAFQDIILGLTMIGASLLPTKTKGMKRNFRITSYVHHIKNLGIDAIFVIVLISATVGAIVTQQGAFQLRNWGAELWVVKLSGKLILRETGVLLAAIMLAGRSGSAITAELGSMKIREELDALTVMGLNPFRILIFPRLLALILSLPCLTIISDLAGLFGAALVENIYSGISFTKILDLLHEGIRLKDFLSGLFKSPFMAISIGIIASIEGLKVKGSAESLGKKVTSSVVRSIFVVILLDGLFTIFFTSIKF